MTGERSITAAMRREQGRAEEEAAMAVVVSRLGSENKSYQLELLLSSSRSNIARDDQVKKMESLC
jgi:hypothetical protein